MNYRRVDTDDSITKRELVEKIKLINEPILLVPICEEAINLVYFVADIFRRNGNYVNIIANDLEEFGMCIIILPFKNMVEDIQITREDCLKSLINNVNNECTYKIVRACGTSISLAWLYSKHLFNTGEWVYCNSVRLNSIPVKLKEKIIYKSTIEIILQKIII